jgi:type VI secretion system protein ImpK
MTDDNDRTVFKPNPGGDRSSMRPTPGRRSGATEVGRTRPATPAAAGSAAAASAPPHSGGGRAGYEQVRFNTALGLNPLVNAASTLIAVFEKTRHTSRHPDVGGLHKRLVNEVRNFEQKAKDFGIKPEIILAARYLLCSALDEAVLHTPWGDESAWGQHTLLSIYHGETFGGEKCFAILDRMLQAPAENLAMLELFYLCLSLGFEGKFRLLNRGRDQLDMLRDNLHRTIRNQRGDFERELSSNWHGLGRVRKTLYHYVPVWVAASVFAVLVVVGYAGFAYWMRAASDPVVYKLDSIITAPASRE